MNSPSSGWGDGTQWARGSRGSLSSRRWGIGWGIGWGLRCGEGERAGEGGRVCSGERGWGMLRGPGTKLKTLEFEVPGLVDGGRLGSIIERVEFRPIGSRR